MSKQTTRFVPFRSVWYVQSAGPDRQEVDYPLGPDPVNAVVMDADGQPPLAVTLELGLQIDNLFVTALLVLAVGLVLILVAIFALRGRRRVRPHRPQPEPATQAGGQR